MGTGFNQFRGFFLVPTKPPDYIYTQICTEVQTVNYNLFDDSCNLIKDIYLSRIVSVEPRDYFNNSLNTYCIYRRNLYGKEFNINCSHKADSHLPAFVQYLYFLGSIVSIEETRDEMIEKLKPINVNILTLTNIKIYNEIFPAIEPYHFHYRFIPTSKSRIIHIDIFNNTFHNLHLYLDNSRMSAHIKDNVFTGSGIKISSNSSTTHQPVILENNVFQGDNSEMILELRDTTNIIIFSCIFKNSKLSVPSFVGDKTGTGMLCYNSQFEMHDIMLRNVSFAPVLAFENCTLSIYNITMLKNNLLSLISQKISHEITENNSLMHVTYSVGTVENIKFEKKQMDLLLLGLQWKLNFSEHDCYREL